MSLEAAMLLEELYVFSFCQEMEYWGIEELSSSPSTAQALPGARNARKKTTEKNWDQKSNDMSTSCPCEESSLRRS